MSKLDNSESRNKFIEIIISIENNNKDDKMLESLLKKNRENFNRRMRASKFDELNINRDKLLYNSRKQKKHRTLKNIKKSPDSLSEKKKSPLIHKNKKHLTQTFNSNYFPNALEEIKDNENENHNSNKNIKNYSFLHNTDKHNKDNEYRSIILPKKNKDEETKNFNEDFFKNDKKLRKLDDLKNFFKLIDTHQKMQFEEDIDHTKPKLNFLRSKNNLRLFKSSITYDKNCIFFNKKYHLIFDRIYKNFKINKKFHRNNYYTINYSSKLTNNSNRNCFIKQKQLHKIESAKNNLLLQKNNQKTFGLRNNLYSLKNIKNRSSKNSSININIHKNNYYLDKNCDMKKSMKLSRPQTSVTTESNIKKYNSLSRPQTAITSESNNTRIKLSSQNQTTDVGETSSLSLVSDINNLKTYNNIKKEQNYSKFHCFTINRGIKYRNNNKKKIYQIISNTLKKSTKMNNILKLRSESKEIEEEKEQEKKIKKLIKKKRTDIDKLIQELNLHYKEQNIDLEELVIKNVYNLKKHLQNMQQFRIMNQIANKVIVEDKILSKRVILESSVEKKLRKRIKTKGDKEFDKLIEKRKYFKNKVMKYSKKTENEEIKGLLKENIFNVDDINSLEEMIFKYRAMSHY